MNKTKPFLHINLLIKDSVQQQINFNGNVFGNKCCRCNEGSLYYTIVKYEEMVYGRHMALSPAVVKVHVKSF